MSRTTRCYPQYYYKLHGNFYYDQDYASRTEWRNMFNAIWSWRPHLGEDYYLKNGRDRKAWHKPNKVFKRIKRQAEKAKVKQAIHRMMHDPEGDNIIPHFPNSDVWDWT